MENFVALPHEQMICVYGGDKAAREERRAARRKRRAERKAKRSAATTSITVKGGYKEGSGAYVEGGITIKF